MDQENTNTILKNVLSEMDKLRRRVVELETLKNDIPTAQQLADEISGKPMELKPLRRHRGLGFRPILESEIIDAQKGSVSAAEVARKLNVSVITYKKYAVMYGLYDKIVNKTGKGVKKRHYNAYNGKYPLMDILAGKYPEYPVFRLKIRLFDTGTKTPCCEQCGYKERRLLDNKIPLLLTFEDGNSKNHKLENIKILCYNCSFTTGKIWIRCKNREKWINDPERMQGSHREIKSNY